MAKFNFNNTQKGHVLMDKRNLLPLLTFGAALALTGFAAHADEATTLASMTKAGCTACHAKDKKLVGPSFKQIAAKYKGQADVVPKLMDKVRKGGGGVFGPVPMAATPPDKISDKELRAAVELILKS